MDSSSHNASARPMLTKDSSAFVVIFAAGFLIFLAIAIVAQTLGWQWRTWLPGAEGVKSMTGGVKAAVYTFMSHLL
jgi:light-harvesting complex 1 beta chain